MFAIRFLGMLSDFLLYLFSNPTLDFVAAPALAPAEVAVDSALMATYEAELKMASNFRPDGLNGSPNTKLIRQRLFPFLMMMKTSSLTSLAPRLIITAL